MKKYVAALLVLLFMLSPVSGYAAASFTLELSAKEVQRGGVIKLSGTAAGETDGVKVKIVSPNNTVFYMDIITAQKGLYSRDITIPSTEDLAPLGSYTVIAGSGDQSLTAAFTLTAGSSNPGQGPAAPTPPPAANSDIPADAGQVNGSNIQPLPSADGRYLVGADKLAEAIKLATKSVTIELPAAAGETGSALEFPDQALNALKAKNLDLIVTTGTRTVLFPAGSLSAGNEARSRIHIVLNAAWSKEAKAMVEQTLRSYPDYTSTGIVLSVVIQVITGDKVTEIHQLGKPATVSVQLTNEQAKQVSSDLAGVYYMDGQQAEYMAGTLKNGTFTFNAEHFSYYTILQYSKSFADMAGHWAESSVKTLTAKHIVNGIDEQHYAPNRSITRAEFVALIMRALEQSGNPLVGQGPADAFKDIPSGQYYTQQVADAAALDIITGYDGKFRPNDSITREEAVVALVRAADYFNLATVKQDKPSFTDAGSISVWAGAAVERAWTKGLIQGDGSKFHPGRSVTRAEVAVMLQRLITDSSQ